MGNDAIIAPKTSEEVGWFTAGLPKLSEHFKAMLRDWSGIDPTNGGLERHVEQMRKEAWKVHKYPCIGVYAFVNIGLEMHPSFQQVFALMKAREESLFVDLGCCFGQDLRSLAHAGIPSARLAGVEVEPDFIDLGYSLFRDREKLEARFLIGDLMTLESSATTSSERPNAGSFAAGTPHELSSLVGRVTVLWASMVLHLWPLSGQVTLCRHILALLEDKPGVRVLGRHVGSRVPAEKVLITDQSKTMYRHNPETFRKMWAEVLGHTGDVGEGGHLQSARGEQWVVKAWFDDDLRLGMYQGQTGDWASKVVKDAEGDGQNATVQDFLDGDRVSVLFWDVERLS